MKTKLYAGLAACALAGLLSLSTVARAEEKSDGAQPATEKRGAVMRDRMQTIAKELNLTDAQKEQLKPILQDEFQKLKALREDQSLSREQKMEKLKAIREELLPQLKAILTPEQIEKWQKLRQERPGKSAAKSGE
jgi:periplasmic protein CpxP/Spy